MISKEHTCWGSRKEEFVGEGCQHSGDLISLFCYGAASPGLALRHPFPPGSFAPCISHHGAAAHTPCPLLPFPKRQISIPPWVTPALHFHPAVPHHRLSFHIKEGAGIVVTAPRKQDGNELDKVQQGSVRRVKDMIYVERVKE